MATGAVLEFIEAASAKYSFRRRKITAGQEKVNETSAILFGGFFSFFFSFFLPEHVGPMAFLLWSV